MDKLNAKVAALVGLVTLIVVGGAGLAGATPIDPVAESTGLVTDGVGELGPVIVAIAGAGLGLLVLIMGLRMAYGVVKSRGSRAI